MQLTRDGHIAHGVLGAGAFLDNVQIDPPTSGGACWYNPTTVLYRFGGTAYVPPPTGGEGAEFCALGFSWFWLLAGLKYYPTQVQTNLNWIASNLKPNYARVMACVGGVNFPPSYEDPWEHVGAYLSWPDHGTLMERATDMLFDYNIKTQWTLLGGLGQTPTSSSQDDLVRHVASHMQGRLHKLILVEMMNEYTVNGGSTSMLRRMAAVARPLFGSVPISLSSPGTVMTNAPSSGAIAAEVTAMYAGQTAANAITPHWNRSNHFPPTLGADSPSLVFCDEPRGPGASTGGDMSDPTVLAGDYQNAIDEEYAGYVYHTDWGVWADHIEESFESESNGWANIYDIPSGASIAAALRAKKESQSLSMTTLIVAPALVFYDTETEVSTEASPNGAEVLLASGYEHWAAWTPELGIFSSAIVGFEHAAGALLAIGPEGSVAYRPTVNGVGLRVWQPNGRQDYEVTANYASDAVVAGEGQILWREGTTLKTRNLPSAKFLGGVSSAPKLALIKDKWWVGYQSTTHGMVLHPLDSTEGFAMPGGRFFDISPFDEDPAVVRWVYASGHSETDATILDINVETTAPNLGDGTDVPGVDPPPELEEPTPPGMDVVMLTSENTFTILPGVEEIAQLPLDILPSYPSENGFGRIIHPLLGVFDYEVKPDEWVNIDAEAIVAPVWSSSRTLTSAANVLWAGVIRDVVVEERWKSLGGLAMPIGQLRMLLAVWTNPVDPDVAYVQWYPNYITRIGFNVLPLNLSVGDQGIALDDVINYKDENGDPIGWVTSPVKFTMKLVQRLEL